MRMHRFVTRILDTLFRHPSGAPTSFVPAEVEGDARPDQGWVEVYPPAPKSPRRHAIETRRAQRICEGAALRAFITRLPPGGAIVVVSSYSMMLHLSRLVREIVPRRAEEIYLLIAPTQADEDAALAGQTQMPVIRPPGLATNRLRARRR